MKAFDEVIRWSIARRAFVLVIALAISAYGAYAFVRMPVDVFPDLTAPTVTIVTEAHGLAPGVHRTQASGSLVVARRWRRMLARHRLQRRTERRRLRKEPSRRRVIRRAVACGGCIRMCDNKRESGKQRTQSYPCGLGRSVVAGAANRAPGNF